MPADAPSTQTPDAPTGGDAPALALPVIPTPDGVLFPEMVVTIALESDEARAAAEAATDDRLLLVPQIDGRYAAVGTMATIEDRGRLPGGTPALTVRVTDRAVIGTGVVGTGTALWLEATPVSDTATDGDELREKAGRYRALATALLDEVGGRRLAAALPEVDRPGALADTIAHWPELSVAQRVELLEAVDVEARLDLAIGWAEAALSEISVTKDIRDNVTSGMEDDQREAILRRQLAAIQAELGEGGADVVAELREKLAALDLPDATTKAIADELDRYERVGDQSQEGSWIRTWLDTVFELPFGEATEDQLDLDHARSVLDDDHTGLDEVKERIVEFLAVRKLRAERDADAAEATDTSSGRPARNRALLVLVGPSWRGQDLPRRVGGPGPGPPLRPDGARWDPRRGRDPRSSPHLRRGPPGTRRPRPRRSGLDEPRHPARRARQGRRRLEGRSVGGAARGPRPGPEPQLPGPLPGVRARPLRRRVHRHRQPARHDPGPAARPDRGHQRRRLHRRREGGHRPRPPAPPSAPPRPA